MKQLPEGGHDAEWSSRLLDDLGFIKQHLRYPISKKTVVPAIMASLSILGGIYFVYWFFFLKSGNMLVSVFLFIVFMLPMVRVARRHLGTLRFIAVPTGHFLAENMQLLQQFLEAERLVVFRHPDAPEVFQIISRNIDAMGDEREVLIFIADDQRILLNSHFVSTRSRFFTSAGYRHHREMAKMFKAWLNRRPSNDKTVVRPRF